MARVGWGPVIPGWEVEWGEEVPSEGAAPLVVEVLSAAAARLAAVVPLAAAVPSVVGLVAE